MEVEEERYRVLLRCAVLHHKGAPLHRSEQNRTRSSTTHPPTTATYHCALLTSKCTEKTKCTFKEQKEKRSKGVSRMLFLPLPAQGGLLHCCSAVR